MFEYLSRLDSAPMPMTLPLGAPDASGRPAAEPALGDPLSPELLQELVATFRERFFSAANRRSDDWISTFRRSSKLVPAISSFLQTQIHLLARDAGSTGDTAAAAKKEAAGVEAWKLVRDECVCAAAQRAALAQRTFLWLLDWKASLDELPDLLARKPELRTDGSFGPLVADLMSAAPKLQSLRVSAAERSASSDSERSRGLEDELHALTTLEEHTKAIGIYLGGLCCLHRFLPPAGADLPSDAPRRSAPTCLGRGAGWAAARLADNAADAHAGKLTQWKYDSLAEQWKVVTHSPDAPTSPETRRVLMSLGLSYVTDADGVTECASSHQESIRNALRDPELTVAAVYMEAHLMRVLEQALDQVFGSRFTRQSQENPDSLPRPESKFSEKVERVYAIQAAQTGGVA